MGSPKNFSSRNTQSTNEAPRARIDLGARAKREAQERDAHIKETRERAEKAAGASGVEVEKGYKGDAAVDNIRNSDIGELVLANAKQSFENVMASSRAGNAVDFPFKAVMAEAERLGKQAKDLTDSEKIEGLARDIIAQAVDVSRRNFEFTKEKFAQGGAGNLDFGAMQAEARRLGKPIESLTEEDRIVASALRVLDERFKSKAQTKSGQATGVISPDPARQINQASAPSKGAFWGKAKKFLGYK